MNPRTIGYDAAREAIDQRLAEERLAFDATLRQLEAQQQRAGHEAEWDQDDEADRVRAWLGAQHGPIDPGHQLYPADTEPWLDEERRPVPTLTVNTFDTMGTEAEPDERKARKPDEPYHYGLNTWDPADPAPELHMVGFEPAPPREKEPAADLEQLYQEIYAEADPTYVARKIDYATFDAEAKNEVRLSEGAESYVEDKYIEELAAKADRIFETETGPKQRAELNVLWDRNEEYLGQAFDRAFPKGAELDVEQYDRFQEFCARSIDAIANPSDHLRQEKEQSADAYDEWAQLNAGGQAKEVTDEGARAQSRQTAQERTDNMQQGWEAGLSDFARALRDENEQNQLERGRGNSLEM